MPATEIVKPLPEYLKNRLAVIKKLHKLVNKTHIFKSRVEFVVLAYRHRLASEISTYQLWDYGFDGLGERALDSCFEMNDGQEVVMALLDAARKDNFLDAIREQVGGSCFEKWSAYSGPQASLF